MNKTFLSGSTKGKIKIKPRPYTVNSSLTNKFDGFFVKNQTMQNEFRMCIGDFFG